VRIALLVILVLAATPAQAEEVHFRTEARRLGRADADLLGALYDLDVGTPCRFGAALFGHFTAPSADEAVVSAVCGDSGLQGNTFLAQRRDGKWTALWRDAHMSIGMCAEIRYQDARTGLLCLESDSHRGERVEALFTVDFAQSERKRQNLIVDAVDTEHAGLRESKPFTESKIERVELDDLLSVRIRYAQPAGELRSKPRSPAKTYQLKFKLQGTQFLPTAETLPLLRMIDSEYGKRAKENP
jgi:hypothetical protein